MTFLDKTKRKPTKTLKHFLIIVALVTISCPQELPPQSKAINLAKESNSLGGELPVERTIEKLLEAQKDKIKRIGWKASEKSDQIYLVSFTYKIHSWDEGSGERGYFFLVNLADETVQNVTSEYEREMKPLSPPYRDEKEIPEKLMQKLREEEKALYGK